MRLVLGTLSLVAAGLMISSSVADEVKSGKFGGAFNVKAITGGQKGKTLCYV